MPYDLSPDENHFAPPESQRKTNHPLSSIPNNTLAHLSLESGREALHVVLQGAVVGEELDVGTIGKEVTSGLLLEVLLATERSEAPVLGDNDLLATRELVLGATESLKSGSLVCKKLLASHVLSDIVLLQASLGERTGVTSPDGHDDLTNVDTGNSAVGLTPGTTHTSLQSIGTSARQHLVDTDDVIGVDTDTEMERLLSADLDEVLVGANTGSLESLGAQLLVLVGHHVDAEGEVVDIGLLASQIEDPDLGVRDTTVEPGLGVRLNSDKCQQIRNSSRE
jgi:hypothetical protein